MSLGEVFTALGYGVGAAVFYVEARRRKMATEGIGWIAGWGLFGGMLGAKITQLAFERQATLDPSAGGRSLFGGLVCGWLCVEVAKRHMRVRRSTGDLFAMALPAGEAVGRIGCFLNGCCYGNPTTVPWAIWQHGAWRHPAQIYSAFVAALLFASLLTLRPYLLRDGDLFRAYLIGFGATRFGLEFVRWRESLWFGLSPMQWFCMEIVLFGAAGFAIRRRSVKMEVA